MPGVLRSRRLYAALVAVLLLGVVALALTLLPSDHYIVLPDKARPTDPLVSAPGERTDGGEGGIYMVDVRIGRASVFERLFPGIHEGAALLPERALNPEGVSDRQRRRASLNDMSRSQLVAIAVALRELGHEVEVEPVGAEVVLVQPGAPAEGELEVGDVIVEAAGADIGTTVDLRGAMSGVEPGEPVDLTVERGEDEQVELTVETIASEQAPGRAVVGVQVQDAEDFDFPVDVDIEAPGIGGPSAGLAFALDIVDELRGDLTRGRTVVVTGELGLDGSVRAIGGIKQKTVGARRAGADIFIVPRANVAEAREASNGDMAIIPVSTFEEALRFLEKD